MYIVGFFGRALFLLQIFARNSEDLTSALAVLKSSITDVKDSIEKSCMSAFLSRKFDQFLTELETQYANRVCFHVNRDEKYVFLSLLLVLKFICVFSFSYIRIVALQSVSSEIHDKIRTFLRKNKAMSSFMNMEEGCLTFLTKHKQAEVLAIQHSTRVEIKPKKHFKIGQ